MSDKSIKSIRNDLRAENEKLKKQIEELKKELKSGSDHYSHLLQEVYDLCRRNDIEDCIRL